MYNQQHQYGVPPPQFQQQQQPQFQGQMPPMQGQPPPPPMGQQQQQQQQNGTTYQGYVKGLHGWNDPPSLIGSSSRKQNAKGGASADVNVDEVLKSVENPVAHVLVGLTTAMDFVKQKVITDPIQRRVLEDTDKRLEELLERLGTQSVPDAILSYLVLLANAFNAKDMAAASKTTMKLTLMSTENHDEAHWIVGAKRLVEMYTRCLQMDQQPQQFIQQPYQQQQQQQQQYGGPARF
ncbi:hypothetical protein CcCBS67573_g07444 [Chytriomyces confervae]|uniref:SRA1/Sec31 domain-containing protein n=1 Tax=Chytriomyces confervae TaxID=246404 RepID=A0A507EU49_9FUNG|nr:hypothetical protein CcCBS67573_g07444 [Chytriomyces confervae]